jgi:hypothetical protein
MGLDQAFNQDVNDRAKAMFGQYKGIWADIVSKSDSSSSSSSAGSPGELAKNMGAKLGSLFHKKKDDSPPAASSRHRARWLALTDRFLGRDA